MQAFLDIEAQMYLGQGLDLSRSRDVNGHVTIRFPTAAPLVLTLYLQGMLRYWGSNVWPLPRGVHDMAWLAGRPGGILMMWPAIRSLLSATLSCNLRCPIRLSTSILVTWPLHVMPEIFRRLRWWKTFHDDDEHAGLMNTSRPYTTDRLETCYGCTVTWLSLERYYSVLMNTPSSWPHAVLVNIRTACVHEDGVSRPWPRYIWASISQHPLEIKCEYDKHTPSYEHISGVEQAMGHEF